MVVDEIRQEAGKKKKRTSELDEFHLPLTRRIGQDGKAARERGGTPARIYRTNNMVSDSRNSEVHFAVLAAVAERNK
jgi:hypothetical protein